jgi:hypothetical protein
MNVVPNESQDKSVGRLALMSTLSACFYQSLAHELPLAGKLAASSLG